LETLVAGWKHWKSENKMAIKYQWDDGVYRDTPEHPNNMSTAAWNRQQASEKMQKQQTKITSGLPKYAAAAADAADPWKSQRKMNQDRLNSLIENPDLMRTDTTDMNRMLTESAAAAAALADPWASQRGQYQTSLSQLLNDPGAAMQENPFFKWQQQQGEQAVNRAAAANGQLTSGNRMTALSDYAQKQSGNQMFQLADLYSLLGGAKNQNPGGAAAITYQGASDVARLNQSQQGLDDSRYFNTMDRYANYGGAGTQNPLGAANLQYQGYNDMINGNQRQQGLNQNYDQQVYDQSWGPNGLNRYTQDDLGAQRAWAQSRNRPF
jgi:hypothetical protein